MTRLDTFTAWEAEVARLGKHYDPNADMAVKDALGLAGEVGEVVELIKKDRFSISAARPREALPGDR